MTKSKDNIVYEIVEDFALEAALTALLTHVLVNSDGWSDVDFILNDYED